MLALQVEKIPKLRSLVSPSEFTHIDAFPAVLRVLREICIELWTMSASTRIVKLTVCRPIDNAALVLKEQEFWTHLNYHLIHALDFVRATQWPQVDQPNDFMHHNVVALSIILRRFGKINVQVGIPDSALSAFKGPKVWDRIVENSKAIGHDRRFWLQTGDDSQA